MSDSEVPDPSAWSGSPRRFRGGDGMVYTIVAKRGITGRFRYATLADDRGEVWRAYRAQLSQPGGQRYLLPSGEALTVVVARGLKEEVFVELDGKPMCFLLAKPMQLDELAKVARRSAGKLLGAAASAACVGPLFLVIGLDAAIGGSMSVGVVVAIAFGALNTWAMVALLRDAIDRFGAKSSSIVQLLTDAPESIAWVYIHVTRGLFDSVLEGEYELVIVTNANVKHELALPADKVDAALRLVRTQAPTASIGYTQEARRKFETS